MGAVTTSAYLIHTYENGVRALCMFDARILKPNPCIFTVAPETGQCPTILRAQNLDWYDVVDFSALLTAFEAVLRGRILVCCWEFLCPSDDPHFANDRNISERRALYTITADVCVFPDSAHCIIGVDHARDIARRVRGW